MDAILPAGGTLSGEFAAEAKTEVKALLRVGGVTLLERGIQALHETGRVRRIVVIGSEEVGAEALRLGVGAALTPGTSGPDNIFRGLDWLEQNGGEERVLIVTTDLPFLSAKAVTDFCDRCPPDADLALPILTQAEFEAKFPGSPSEYVPLREDRYTLGSAALLRADTLRRNRSHLESVFSARKSQLGMARLLGLPFVVKFLLKRLSVEDIEARLRALLHCQGNAVPHSPAELALDIDTLEDYRYALLREAQL